MRIREIEQKDVREIIDWANNSKRIKAIYCEKIADENELDFIEQCN